MIDTCNRIAVADQNVLDLHKKLKSGQNKMLMYAHLHPILRKSTDIVAVQCYDKQLMSLR